jgi:hypothetical protein
MVLSEEEHDSEIKRSVSELGSIQLQNQAQFWILVGLISCNVIAHPMH